MNEPQALARIDAEQLASINRARDWFQGPLGNLMPAEGRRLLCDELTRHFGGYPMHYGPHAGLPPNIGQIQRGVRLGPSLPGVDIAREEGVWLLSEHAADVVLLQRGLDFCLLPHRLLHEVARTVRPGGHLLLIGINLWSLRGIRHYFAEDILRQTRCIPPSWACDWLNLLGFVLEKRRFGYYRPPFAPVIWQLRLARLERWGDA